MNKLIFGDNTETLKSLPANSVDAVITDSPYGLGKEPDAVKCLQDWIDHGYHEIKGAGFMGKHWDAFVPQPLLWKECFRVLKPGGYLLSFFGTRTYDWGTLAIRLAGFEIRDCIFWVYGSGFPKSLDISKAIDKAAGAEREILSIGRTDKRLIPGADQDKTGSWIKDNGRTYTHTVEAPATDDAKKWNGYGTALKPACEPICVARKPLEGTVIENVLKWGVGGINIDAGRVEFEGKPPSGSGNTSKNAGIIYGVFNGNGGNISSDKGRWPANIIHDGSDDVLGLFPAKAGQAVKKSYQGIAAKFDGKYNNGETYEGDNRPRPAAIDDLGSAARFFYCAKASPAERAGRKHPTIKPLALMKYLVEVFCPPGGVCLDPHIGSGTTAVVCIETGRQFIGIDNDQASFDEATKYVNAALWNGL